MPDQPPRLRIRFEFDGRHTLGPGKVQLLEAVGELGSISAAARRASGPTRWPRASI